jgi:cytochrome d ubiquinol oxidase subunit II
MPDPAAIVAGVLLVAMTVYVCSGGADFGGGLWQLFARGPRARQQVRALHTAIAPIWEANHVWLIVIVVLLFACFPKAFAAMMVTLHLPISLLLVGIVLRGAAFVFQSYAAGDRAVAHWSVRVFRLASAITPVMLGVIAGTVASGDIRIDAVTGAVSTAVPHPWLRPFPLLVGLMTVSLCAYLAAVYMTVETQGALREDFRARALLAGLAVGGCALPAALAASRWAPVLGDPLMRSSWSLPLHGGTGAVAVLALGALWMRRFRAARFLVIAQTALILTGWALAQYPHALAPDLHIAQSGSSPAVHEATLWVLALGSVVLVPAFFWLYVVFKSHRAASLRDPQGDPPGDQQRDPQRDTQDDTPPDTDG